MVTCPAPGPPTFLHAMLKSWVWPGGVAWGRGHYNCVLVSNCLPPFDMCNNDVCLSSLSQTHNHGRDPVDHTKDPNIQNSAENSLSIVVHCGGPRVPQANSNNSLTLVAEYTPDIGVGRRLAADERFTTIPLFLSSIFGSSSFVI